MTELFARFRRFVIATRHLNINAYAASAAFFLFVSLVPILVLICSIFPYTGLTERELIELIEASTPIIFNEFLENMVSQIYDSTAGVITISIVATIWTAGKGIMALVQGLDRVNEVKEERNWFRLRLSSCFYMVVMMLTLLLSISIVVIGTDLFKRVIIHLRLDVAMLKDLLMRPRLLYTFIILSLVFALFYTWMPYRGPQNKLTQIRVLTDRRLVRFWNESDPSLDEEGNSLQTNGLRLRYIGQLPGACFAAGGWIGSSVLFTMIVNMGYGITLYGAMSFLVISMLWIYCCMYLLLLGAYINHVYTGMIGSVSRKKKDNNA